MRLIRMVACVLVGAWVISLVWFVRSTDLFQKIYDHFTAAEIFFALSGMLIPILVAVVIDWCVGRWTWFRGNVTIIAVIMLVLAAACAAYLFWAWDHTNPNPIAAIIAAALAAVGWLTTQELTRNLQKKRHTMEILIKIRESAVFDRHRLRILKQYPPWANVSKDEVDALLSASRDSSLYDDKSGEEPLYNSIAFIANYYEFLASGVRQGDLDFDLLNETYGSIILRFYEKFRPLLLEKQQLDQRGRPTTRIFNNLWWLERRLRYAGAPVLMPRLRMPAVRDGLPILYRLVCRSNRDRRHGAKPAR